ncbi:MAG: insulinase family protein [Anaerolineales bacterium]|nr:insulinase family protein [Anaerolineales bacterium]
MIRPRSALPGPEDTTRAVLANGVTVLSRLNPNSPSVVISGYVQAGSLFDPDEALGLANFAATALMRGTAEHDMQGLYDALESVGASLSFSAGVHTAGFSGRSLSEDLPLLLGLLGEALRRPAFPPEQIERLRAQLLTGLAMRAQDTSEMASLTFDKLVFKGHPYSRPEDGLVETIQAITPDDLAAFHQHHYGPRGMVLAIVGAIDPQKAVTQAEKVLGNWSNPAQPELPVLPPLKPLTRAVTSRVKIPGKSQSDLIIGTSGPTRRDPGFHAALLGNSILGQFGMMGRIGDVVREKSGLAYYAYSTLHAGIGPGAWEVSAGVNPGNIQKARDLICGEIARFLSLGVSAEELADSQSNFIGRLPFSLESNAGVAGALLNIERYGLGLNYYQRYADLLRAVTPEEVVETARKYLDPDRLATAIAGP